MRRFSEKSAEGEWGGLGRGGGGLGEVGRGERKDTVEQGLRIDAIGKVGRRGKARWKYSQGDNIEDLLCVGGIDWDIGREW